MKKEVRRLWKCKEVVLVPVVIWRPRNSQQKICTCSRYIKFVNWEQQELQESGGYLREPSKVTWYQKMDRFNKDQQKRVTDNNNDKNNELLWVKQHLAIIYEWSSAKKIVVSILK